MSSDEKPTFRRLGAYLVPLTYVAWTLAALRLLVTDQYLAFLAPRLTPLMVISVIGLTMFACVSLSYRGHVHHGVGQSEMIARALVLCVPLVFLVVLPQGGLGSHALSQAEAAAGAIVKDLAPQLSTEELRTHGGPAELTLLQIAAHREALAGREVQTIGMIARRHADGPGGGKKPKKEDVRLFRFIIVCCAADRRPIAVRLAARGGAAEGLANIDTDQWVRVRGEVLPDAPGPGAAALVRVSEIHSIEVPPLGQRFLQAR